MRKNLHGFAMDQFNHGISRSIPSRLTPFWGVDAFNAQFNGLMGLFRQDEQGVTIRNPTDPSRPSMNPFHTLQRSVLRMNTPKPYAQKHPDGESQKKLGNFHQITVLFFQADVGS